MTDMSTETHITPRTCVVVVGGGYAGTLAANHLQTRRDIAVTLVNPRPEFVERIRLHQMVADTGSATVDYADMLHPSVSLLVDTATEIDAANRRVRLASGSGLRYDYLIYAVGSTAAPAGVPGAAEFAFPIGEFEYALRLKNRIDELHPSAPICVVGGGLTGIETAAELAERGPERDVTLICGPILGPSLSEPGRRSVARQLARLKVRVLQGSVAEIREFSVVADRRARTRQRRHRLDGRVRCPGPGRTQRVEHRRAGQAAHRRDADERRRRADRRRGRLCRAVGSAAADELPGGRPAGRTGGQHGAAAASPAMSLRW